MILQTTYYETTQQTPNYHPRKEQTSNVIIKKKTKHLTIFKNYPIIILYRAHLIRLCSLKKPLIKKKYQCL